MRCPACGTMLDDAGWCKLCIDKPSPTLADRGLPTFDELTRRMTQDAVRKPLLFHIFKGQPCDRKGE